MFLKKISVGMLGVNCYIIADEKTSKAAVIDPGGNAYDIQDILSENELSLEYIILTHGHADHIGAVLELKDKNECIVVSHEYEKEILIDADKNLSTMLRMGQIEFEADKYVKDNDVINLGSLNLKIMHTPGHTKGGICIVVDDYIFSGDTLFAGSIGRSDFYGGNQDILLNSLKKLAKLDDELTVFPGHGPASRLGIEKVTNPYMA